MGIALPISLIFSTCYFILFPDFSVGSNYIFGFMWYVPMMFVGFLFYFFVFKIKSNKVKISLITLTVLLCYVLYFVFGQLRIFSPFAGIGLGILISYLPKIKKLELNITLSIILSIVIMILIIFCAVFPKNTILLDCGLIFLLFPMFLYVCTHFSINIKLFNHLGKISFGLYAMQTIVRILVDCNICRNRIINFLIIVSLATLCYIIDCLIIRNIKKHKTQQFKNQFNYIIKILIKINSQ